MIFEYRLLFSNMYSNPNRNFGGGLNPGDSPINYGFGYEDPSQRTSVYLLQREKIESIVQHKIILPNLPERRS